MKHLLFHTFMSNWYAVGTKSMASERYASVILRSIGNQNLKIRNFLKFHFLEGELSTSLICWDLSVLLL